MVPEFVPLFRNPHISTIAGNYWQRKLDLSRFPAKRVEYETAANTRVVAFEHQPDPAQPLAQIVLLHGLEGSHEAGYILSLSQAALCQDFGVHRLNMRSCGGTENLSETMYHSGLTEDTLQVLKQIRSRYEGPIFLCGFSLGGNVTLKLAGELGWSDLLCGVCAVSTPIELATAVKAIGKAENTLYANRFLSRLKARVRRKNKSNPGLYSTDKLDRITSIWEFDDHYTAPLFGFGTAANYYETQSAAGFLAHIRVPALLVTAQNDPLVPFAMYQRQEIKENPAIELNAPEFGGHLGFISRVRPRFWLDQVVMTWIGKQSQSCRSTATGSAHFH